MTDYAINDRDGLSPDERWLQRNFPFVFKEYVFNRAYLNSERSVEVWLKDFEPIAYAAYEVWKAN